MQILSLALAKLYILEPCPWFHSAPLKKVGLVETRVHAALAMPATFAALGGISQAFPALCPCEPCPVALVPTLDCSRPLLRVPLDIYCLVADAVVVVICGWRWCDVVVAVVVVLVLLILFVLLLQETNSFPQSTIAGVLFQLLISCYWGSVGNLLLLASALSGNIIPG